MREAEDLEDLRHNTLKEIKMKGVLMKRKIFLVTHKKRPLPLGYRTFLENIFWEMESG